MEPTEITAGRLHLRPWQPEDAPEVLEACQDPDVQRWTTVPVPYTASDAREYVQRYCPQQWASGEGASFAVLDAVTGRVLASVALMRVCDGSAEIGYWTAPAARGQGVVPEAVGAVCRWAFAAGGLERVVWLAEVGNWASRAAAEKAGFRVEGVLRRGLVHRGRRVDVWTGSLLAGDEPGDRRAFGAFRGLRGLGLLLRWWSDGDVDALLSGAADPETALWTPVPSPWGRTQAEQAVRERYPRAWVEGTAANLAVVEDGDVVGGAVLVLRGERSSPEVGWWTAPGSRGRGVAGRAARLVADWAADLGHARVEALVDVDNSASQRVAERAGFVREGVLRAARPDRAGRPRDMVLFAAVR